MRAIPNKFSVVRFTKPPMLSGTAPVRPAGQPERQWENNGSEIETNEHIDKIINK